MSANAFNKVSIQTETEKIIKGNIGEFLNQPNTCHDKLTFLINNVKAKSLFKSFLSIEYPSISFYFVLWEQIQNLRNYIPSFTYKKFKKTADILFKRHFCQGAPYYIELDPNVYQQLVSSTESEKSYSFDIIFEIEAILEKKMDPLMVAFIQFLNEIPLDTLKRTSK